MMQEDSNGDFEIVDKKMATLLASDPSGGSSSVLTNVSPPSALPSFLASPLPAAAPSAPQPSPLPMAPAVSVPYNPADGGNIMRPPSGPPPVQSPGPILPSSGVPPPPPGVRPPPGVPPPSAIPHPSGVPPLSGVHPPSGVPLPSGVRPPSGVPLPSGVRPPSSAFPPTTAISPSPIPFPPPNSAHPQGVPVPAPGHPSPVSPSHPVASQAPVAAFVPSSGPSLPITTHSQAPPSVVGNVDAASVDLGSPGVVSGRPGWFGWIRGTVSNVSHRVAEKARSSMDTMITTLDPQMKEFIHSGGDMDIVVASDKEVKVGAIRESFQLVFGKATVVGLAAKSESVAMQPVGFEAALRSAEERINSLRSSGQVHPQQPVVSLENFIVEFTPECWYEMGLLLLDDPGEDIILQTYTQVTPVPPDFITQARAATKDDYPFKTTGFAATVGHIASQALQIHHTMWQEVLTGVSRRDTIVLAARTLATLYKSRLPRSI